MNLPVEFYIAARYIRANLRQSLIIMLAVGMGVSIIIFIPSINLSFFNYFLTKTVQSAAHINVTRAIETMPRNEQALHGLFPGFGQIITNDQTLTRRRNITAYRRLTDDILKIPGVTAAAPYIKEQVIIVRGSQSRAADINGIIPERERRITNIAEDVEVGNLDTLSSGQVFLGHDLAEELGVGLGDRVQLLSSHGTRSYKVVGLIKTGIYLRDLSIVYMPLKSAQQLLNLSNEVTGIGVKVADIYDAQRIARLIANIYGVKTRSWMEDNKVYLDQIDNFRVIIRVISFLIIFSAASSITSVLIMVVASKSREIGILKAMGSSSGSIMRLFVAQAVILSLLGVVVGVGGGAFLIALYNFSPMSKGSTILGIERPPSTMNLEYTILAIIYAVISSVLASLFPAWRAGKLDPVEAITQ